MNCLNVRNTKNIVELKADFEIIQNIIDYLNNYSYYKTTYNEYNFIRAKNQWALYYSLKR